MSAFGILHLGYYFMHYFFASQSAHVGALYPARAVQVDPIKPTLKAPGTKRLKLKHDKLLSSFAVNFNLRRYDPAFLSMMLASGAPPALAAGPAHSSTAHLNLSRFRH
jgi:hypothetical protein